MEDSGMTSFRIGVDVGGTFTDTVLVDENGDIAVSKVPTTPENRSVGSIRGIKRVLAGRGGVIDSIIHGTTTPANAVIQRKGGKCALMTNAGFRDVLEIGRQNRPSLYDLFADRPEPLVPRELRIGVKGGVDYKGDVIDDLDEDEIRETTRWLRDEKVDVIAVCMLHSYANPEQERRIKDIVEEECDTPVCISSEVLPTFREYERMNTTVLNAYLMPVMDAYLRDLETRLVNADIARSPMIMRSDGGIMNVSNARQTPVRTVLSGPAGGVVAGELIGSLAGYDDLITIDMGGTSSDISLISGGKARLTAEGEIAGIPIAVPMIDIRTIGAGGGSMAWVDGGGALRVGPQSAEATPGPACYGLGGTEPTVTDANIVLGRLNSDFFLGGKMKIEPELAERSMNFIRDSLNMDVIGVALGIIEISNANMIGGIRVVSIERGYDPRDFVMLAFGGAAPLHAVDLARELEIPAVIVPQMPGLLSAFGMLASDVKHDFVITYICKPDEDLDPIFGDLESKAYDQLHSEGFSERDMLIARWADMRYVGQAYELCIPAGTASEMVEGFHSEHERVYGHADPESAVELVNLRVLGIGRRSIEPKLIRTDEMPRDAVKYTREVYFDEWIEVPFFDRSKLYAGNVVEGPAVVEEIDSTILIHPGSKGRVDRYGNVIIDV
jgi:N-methylhydantoinase A